MGVPRSEKVKAFTIGAVLGLLPAIGVAWAFAVTAAEHVMDPHLSSSKERVRIMCIWAKTQNENTRAICDKLGATCKSLDAEVLLSSCNESHGD